MLWPLMMSSAIVDSDSPFPGQCGGHAAGQSQCIDGFCGHPAASLLVHSAMLIFFGQTTLAVAAPVYPAEHVPDYDPGTKSRPRIINQRFFNKVPDMLVSTREFWLDYKLE